MSRNRIYVIPPGHEITLEDGHFAACRKRKSDGWPNVITIFLDSRVNSRHDPRIAVDLSGLDSDGAAALKTFRRSGGIAIVQAPGSAKQPDMPTSALETGSVD